MGESARVAKRDSPPDFWARLADLQMQLSAESGIAAAAQVRWAFRSGGKSGVPSYVQSWAAGLQPRPPEDSDHD